MINKISILLIFFLIGAGLVNNSMASAAGEAVLLGTSGFGSSSSTLVEIDPATGATVNTIGPVGYIVNGMEYDHTTGMLYGSTSLRDPNFNGLIEIDPGTGVGTPIGVHGWGYGSPRAITNITVDSTGQMYGFLEFDSSGNDDVLVMINKLTGIPTVVGAANLPVNTRTYGLSFDNNDTLYLINFNGTYTLDTGTGAATPAGSIGTVAHHGDFNPDPNWYYGINSNSPPKSLVVADLSTGEVISTFDDLADDIHTLTFISANKPPEALCKDVTVDADATGKANADIDAGSNDPDDGDDITITQNPPGPYGLGDTEVTLTVTDESGESDSCTATVTVEDNSGPVVTATLVPVNVKKRIGYFRVECSAEDNCDDNPQVVATINGRNGARVVDGQLVELEHKKKHKHKHKHKVKTDDGDSDSSDDCGSDRFEGPVFTLFVGALDSAGNLCEESDTFIFYDVSNSGSGHKKKKK